MNACFVLSSEDVSHAGGPKTQPEQNWQWQDRFLLVLSAAFFSYAGSQWEETSGYTLPCQRQKQPICNAPVWAVPQEEERCR